MPTWTDNRLDRLKTLWREGVSASAIARDLGPGVSRNAVLGKVHRMGLSASRASPPAPISRTAPPRVDTGPRRPRPAPSKGRRSPENDLSQTPDVGGRTILSVRRGECRWPFGDPEKRGFSLCGEPVGRGAFCAAHAAIAYRAAPVSAESLMNLAGVA